MDWIALGQIVLFGILIVQIVMWVIGKKKKEKDGDMRFHPQPPPLPGPMTQTETQWFVEAEAQLLALARSGLAGRAVIPSEPEPLETRLGGPLIVPKGNKAPSSQFGKPLHSLLLLRLADLPRTEGNVLPKDGWIQVLIEPDDPLNMPPPISQSEKLRVIHFPEGTEFDVYPADPSGEGLDLIWYSDAIDKGALEAGFGIAFEPVTEAAPNGHYKLKSYPKGTPTKEFEDASEKLYYAVEKERVECDVMIGGQAVFTQDDIRYLDSFAGFENLIRMSGYGEVFVWADMGEANILVPAGDLGTGELANAVFHLDFH